MNHKECELVIVSPGVLEPGDGETYDPWVHHLFWCGNGHWSKEYPDAEHWCGDDPNELFYDEEAGCIDEDLYGEYLWKDARRASKVLHDDKRIPKGSCIVEGVGYARGGIVEEKE